MELRDFVKLIKSRWRFIAALVVVGLVAAVAFSAISKPQYESTAKTLVSTPAASNATDLAQGNTFTQNVVTTYAEVATTPYVLNTVIKNLNLTISAADLADDVSASAPASTAIIEITVTSSSAKLAAQIANGIAAELAKRVPAVTPSTKAGTSAVAISTIQPAVAAKSPKSPSWPLDLAIGLLVGLIAGVGIVVLRESSDTRLKDVEDAATVTKRPILGSIGFDGDAKRSPLIIATDARSQRAEEFRSLRTNLQFLTYDGSHRVMVMTSTIKGEGKTSSVANTAIALANAGKRVVVVDGDLRCPRVADYFGMGGGVGLTDVLIGDARLHDVLQTSHASGVVVLAAGRIPPNPSELLQSRPMADVLAELKSQFDFVLIDTPPVIFTDAAILTQLTDGAILVAAAGKVRRESLTAAVQSLEQVGGRVLGVVVTMARGSGAGTGNYGVSASTPVAPQRPARALSKN